MKKLFKATTAFSLLVMLSTLAPVCQAQDARAFLQKSVKAYGKWNEVQSLEYEVAGSRDAGAQARIYKSGERQSYSARRVYSFPEKKLYEANLNKFPGGYVFHFATTVHDTLAHSYDIAGTRAGKVYFSGGKADAERRWGVVNNHIAYYKIKELQLSSDSLQVSPVSDDSHVIIRRIQEPPKTAVDYYFSSKTNLLEKAVSQQAGKQIELLYGDYETTAGRMDNKSVKVVLDGSTAYEETIHVNQVNFTFDNKLLALPKGYLPNSIQEPSKPKEIAKDVYLIERLAGDRNVLFVNMDKYITVLEAPVSAALSKQVIQMIKEVIPGKPIKYVLTTHYHSDHSGGLRQYAHEGTELLMAAPTQPYVEELLAAVQEDDFEKVDKTATEFNLINGKFVLEDENHLIEFYEVPNSHCSGMVLAYFPKEKLVYQGDLLSVPLDGTLPHAIEVTREMNRFLSEQNISFTRMIGHHGHSFITPQMLEQIMFLAQNSSKIK